MAEDPFGSNPIALEDAEQAAIQSWVDQAARRLALPHWTIVVSPHAAPAEYIAVSSIREQSDFAWIALAASWRKTTRQELRHSLTHELLHPHIGRITGLAERLIQHELGRRSEAIIVAALKEVEETTIDRLAGAIAEFLPLVELPGDAP